MMKSLIKKASHYTYESLLILYLFLIIPAFVLAAVMQSGSYSIDFDSINVSGGNGTSTSYDVDSSTGEIATGEGASTNYKVSAGYQQVVNEFISVSSPTDITMPSLSVSNNTAVGSTTWTVITNAPNGYTLSAQYSAALTDATTTEAFADYSEVAAGVPELWSVDSGVYEFGFSAYGTHASALYGTGTTCGTIAAPDTNRKWEGLSTVANIVASHTSDTDDAGEDTTLCLATGQQNVFAPAGIYHTTITITAITL